MFYVALNLVAWVDCHRVRSYRLPVIPSTNDFLRPNPTAPYFLQIFTSFVVPCHAISSGTLTPSRPTEPSLSLSLYQQGVERLLYALYSVFVELPNRLGRLFRILPFLGSLVPRYVVHVSQCLDTHRSHTFRFLT